MRVLLTGSRNWINAAIIECEMVYASRNALPENCTLVHGACPTGADAMADNIAKRLGWNREPHPANWEYGRAAGPIRNTEMVNMGADICLAFIVRNSKGAAGCARLAVNAGIPTRHVNIHQHYTMCGSVDCHASDCDVYEIQRATFHELLR